MQATTFLFTNRQKGAIGKNDLYMKNLVTLRFMLVSLFAIMSMAVSADIIEYSTGDGLFRYKLDTEAKTAELAKYYGSATEVSISESVTYYGGEVYRVTSLGEYCFSRCSSLTSINIPSSVTSLGERCFLRCSSLKTVTCEIPAPIGDNSIFSDAPINEATLYVPEASLNSYKTTSPWSDFGTILAIKSSGIETNTVGTSATVDAIYNLEGKRNGGIKSGMNILRMSDGTTRKIMK